MTGVVGAAGVPAAQAADNGVERTPVLGWSSWSFLRDQPTAAKIEAQAAANYVHRLGLKFGIYVTPGISKQAVAQNTPIKGTGYTADQIAESSAKQNNYNCGGMVGIDYSKPGAQAYTNSWADLLASWGVDYVKFDGITNKNTADIEAWSKALRQTGRPMVLNITQGSYTTAIAPTLMKYANQWEFAPDIECYDCEIV
ncbi:MAG TPA: hypothetical protein VG268_02915 [Streptosporangiaceae bacterium]|nr:hypothetical protein [Streptosporangiaceae bacterium]